MSIEKALKHYISVRDNLKEPNFFISRKIPAKFTGSSTNEDLWREHHRIEGEFKAAGGVQDNSFLDLKVEIADRMLRNCSLCSWRCQVDRSRIPGRCGVLEPRISAEFLHFGEEPPLVPSHTIFFSGCTLKCVFCQNWDISQNPSAGRFIGEDKLADLIEKRRGMGSANVNFVGGDPTPNLPYILRVISRLRVNIPVVWNSNMYLTRESMALLNGVTDLYLTDFKFGNSECAEELAGVLNYFEVVSENHILASRSADIIIRHLVLPGHMECCTKPLISWIAENLGNRVVLNVMGQYRPVYRAMEFPGIDRYPTGAEIREARNWAGEMGLKNLI